MSMRLRERRELESKFEAFFSRWRDIEVDVNPLREALERERRICESETLTDSSYLVELLKCRLARKDSEILKMSAKPLMVPANQIKEMLIEVFTLKRRGVRDLAAQLDTIHRLAPFLCECLHGALVSSPGAARKPEEWEEFFLEPDRVAAEADIGMNSYADRLNHDAIFYHLNFPLERAIRTAHAPYPRETIKAILDWPCADSYSYRLEEYRAQFLHSFHQLPPADQERALPCMRETVFEELVPEDPNAPWSHQESTADRWFVRILSFSEQTLASLFGSKNAKDVMDLAKRARDEQCEASTGDAAASKRESRQDERLKSIEEQLNYFLGPDRINWMGKLDGGAALNHLLDMVLNAQEKTSVYIFHEGSYPTCSQYCDLLWDKAVSAILLEQRVTIVESAYEQWRWLEFMRKLSIIRLRSQHPGRRLGWRW